MSAKTRTKSRRLGSAVAGLFIASATSAPLAADGPQGAIVRVVYVAPEKFTDVGDDGYVTTDQRRNALLAQLKRHIETRATPRVPAGTTLTVTVSDIDMAGGFEPWRGPNLAHVRVVRDVYPPRIKLAFRLTAPGGNLINEGVRELTDLAFLTSILYRDDLLRHEKKLLDDWIEREFPRPPS